MAYQIEFEPVDRRGKCPKGKNLLECAQYLGVQLISICGGFGKCKACKIKVLKGQVSKLTSTEFELFSNAQILDGWRLACLTYPESDCIVDIPPESLTTLQRMQVESQNISSAAEPAVSGFSLTITEPNFTDLRADSTRVLESLEQQHKIKCNKAGIEVLRDISLNLRSSKWQTVAFVRGDEVIALKPTGTFQLGLAVDIGTTKIAGYLLDMRSGQTLASKGMMNPQISFGEDITSRIHHALKSPDKARELQQTVVIGLNQLADELCTEIGASVTDIIDSTFVGNTAIHHLFLGLPIYPLVYPPFCAAVQDALDIKARDAGLCFAPGAYAHILPNIAGFVGADHVSMLIAIDALKINKLTLAIDIGTNTEISLIKGDEIYSASCASGPAFEGGHISCGMRAATGAIERLRIENDNIQYQTINRVTPVGICGSGIIDTIAQMYNAGIIDESGRMKRNHPAIRSNGNVKEFVIYPGKSSSPPVMINQLDVREVQLGKAAIRAGIQVLLETAGCTETDIWQVIIAGAFGTYIDIANAILLGMLPVLPLERFIQIGNAAGLGARQTLISIKIREMEKIITRRMHYIELANAPSFKNTFVQAQYLGKYQFKDMKREKITS